MSASLGKSLNLKAKKESSQMTDDYARFEGYIAANNDKYWNQSYYYNAFDPKTGTALLIRVGLLENQQESNSWFIVFQNGRPIFARTNINLPYTKTRPMEGMELAGMRITAEVPLKKTRITFKSPNFSAELVWDELHPLADCIAMSNDNKGSFATDIAHIHLEGTSTVTGYIEHYGQRSEVNAKGFRDIAAGPRNWDALKHYRLGWPIFENGMALSAIRGMTTGGQSAYMKMFHDGTQWRRIQSLDEELDFVADGFAVSGARFNFVDDQDRKFHITAKPLFGWLFPVDTFLVREQLAEFRLNDTVVGHGMVETGYRLPFNGVDR
jgi:hypothetical protein